MRKIVELKMVKDRPFDDSENVLIALCDDGSAWFMLHYGDGWKRLPSIPQDPESPTP